jgi:predicted RNA-binding Zn-ribbon protein involved in translation (DUF1610 family)
VGNPDIQYFASSGTWVKPTGAVTVDIVLCGGDGGAFTWPGGGAGWWDGELNAKRFLATELPAEVSVRVGKGGRPGGRDGYALIVTHLAGDEDKGEDCGHPFDYEYTCPACGHKRITNHCPHDGVQNPCPKCGHTDPGKETPMQFLGVTWPPGAEGDQ